MIIAITSLVGGRDYRHCGKSGGSQ